jgi:hypothetical protein
MGLIVALGKSHFWLTATSKAIHGRPRCPSSRQRLPTPAMDMPNQAQTGRFERVLSGASKPNP